MIYVSIISLVSCGIYGYALNQIGQIVDSFEKKTEQFNKDMQILNRQMNQRALNSKLQHKVRKYFEYLHKEEQVDDDKANQMIANLPSSMKQSIIFDINYKVLYSQKVFSLNFSKSFLDVLALEMKTLKLGPEIDLFTQSDTDDRCYFIMKGQVEIYINLSNRQKTCYILKKGNMFGDIEFLCQQHRIKAAKTLNVVTLLYIDFKDFINCIKNFDEDFQKYSMIKDKACLYNNLEGLDRRCLSCHKFNHQFVSCPQLQYWPNMDKLIYDSNKTYFQERTNECTRKDRDKYSALKYQNQNQHLCRQFNYTNEMEEDNEENDQNDITESESLQLQQQQNESFGGQIKLIKQNTFQNYNPANQIEDFSSDIPSNQNINIPNTNAYTPVVGGQRNKGMNMMENDKLRRGNSRKVSKKLSIKKDVKRNIQQMSSLQYDDEIMSPTKRNRISFELSQIDMFGVQQQQQQQQNNYQQNTAPIQPSQNSLTQINSTATAIAQQLHTNSSTIQHTNTLQSPVQPLQQQLLPQSQFSQSNQKQQQLIAQQALFMQQIQGTSLQLIPIPQNSLPSNENNQTGHAIMPQVEFDCYKTYSKMDYNYTNSKNTKSQNDVNLANNHSERYVYIYQDSFDKMRIFKIYFPQNNVTNVLRSYQRFSKQTSSLFQLAKANKKRKLIRH